MKVKLEELVEEVSERTTVNNQYPVLTSSRSGIYLQEEYFKKQVASKDNTGYRIIRKGEFTYRAMSDTGEFYPNKLECTDIGIVSPAYPVFKIKDNRILPDYLKYYFKSRLFQKSITAFVQGSTRASMKFGKMKLISIDLPDKDKQNQILNTIGILKGIIDKYELEIDHLNNLIKARFVEMFNCDKSNIKKLSELTETITKGTTPTTAGFSFEDDGINFFKIESITDDHRINLQKVAHVNEECHSTFKRSQLKEGDVLFSIAGAIGRTAIIHDKDLPGNTNQALAIIRLKANSNVSRKYLISALESPEVVEQYRKKKRGVAQMNLSLQDIGNISIPVPNSTKQSEFEKFAQQVDKSKFTLSNELAMCNFYVRLINDSITHSRIDLRMSE